MKEAPDLKSMGEKELLQLYATLIDELRDRHIIRSSNNLVADYAEKVAEEYLGLRRVGKEEKGYDAIDNKGMTSSCRLQLPLEHPICLRLGCEAGYSKP